MVDPDRRTFIKGIGAASAVGIAGCSSDGSGGDSTPTAEPQDTQADSTSTATPEPETDNVDLAVAHYQLIQSGLPVYIAEQQGYWEENNIDLSEVTSFAGGGETIRGITSGGLQAGNGSLPALLRAHQAGAPIFMTSLLTGGNTSTIEFGGPPDSEIEEIQDLAGGSIAYSTPGSTTHAQAMWSVHQAEGISLDDVEFRAMGGLGEASTAVFEGIVDAACFVSPTATRSRENGNHRTFWDVKPENAIVEQITMMGPQMVDDNQDLARRIMRTYSQATDFILNNTEEACEMWAEVHPPGMSAELLLQSMNELPAEDLYNLAPNEDLIKRTADALIAAGELDEEPDWSNIIRQDVLPEEHQVDWL